MLKIALYHGYELTGSGSNEYTRYLSRTLAQLGHEVSIICGEPDPAAHPFVSRAVAHAVDGTPTDLFSREKTLLAPVTLHQLPRTSVMPVFITDQQREGNVKTFLELSEDELEEYHRAMVATLTRALEDERPDVLHVNHLIYQPVVAAEACRNADVPFYVVPHGSAIEYTIEKDERFRDLARVGLTASAGIAWISREVRERVQRIYSDLIPEIEAKSHLSGVGTDTSLFTPLPARERRASLDQLATLHIPGGKTAAQRAELRERLDAGDIECTRAYWDAYNHKLADDDLPDILRRIPVEQDLLFFVGSMTYGKGIQSLIAALPGILARRPDTHLVLVGSGTFREVLEALIHSLATANEMLFDELVRRGRDLERSDMSGSLEDLESYASVPANRAILFDRGVELAEHIHIIGRLDHAKLRCVFPCCRIAVFPSVIKEASPLVFAEAMANGVLPTGSYHSGLRDGLDDLQPDIPADIWQCMKLESDPTRRIGSIVENLCGLLESLEKEDLSPVLRRIAEERCDWTAVAQQLAEAAETMIDAPR